jgi:hypothetical protein
VMIIIREAEIDAHARKNTQFLPVSFPVR